MGRWVWALVATACLARAALGQEAGVRVRAPELSGGAGWFNVAAPLRLADLRGKVVLLDFWTSCCINCLHVLPDLEWLEEKHGDALVVVGVHSGKFDHEKDGDAIRQAVVRYGVRHPVVNDRDLRIWRAYAVRAWPTFVLLDAEGREAARMSGEGRREALDQAITSLVGEARAAGTLDTRPLPLAPELGRSAALPLRFPGKVLAEDGGRLFVADSGHHRVVVADLDGRVLDVAGSGEPGAADGPFERARFREPQGLALDGDRLYVADRGNHTIRVVDLRARTVSTLAGTGKQGRSPAKGPLREVSLGSPWDLARVGRSLYVAMAGPHQIWRADLDAGTIGPFAGSGREDLVDGPRGLAALAQPSGLASDGNVLYVADSETSAVRAVELKDGGPVRTLVGDGLFTFGDADGALGVARLQHPLGVALHGRTLYVADTYNHKIKAIDLGAGTIRTFAGTGRAGDTDGPGARLNEPSGLAVAKGALYVADSANHAVRRVDLATGEVRTVALRPPLPRPSMGGAAPDPRALGVKPSREKERSLRADSDAELAVELALPPGLELNEQAPLRLEVSVDGDAVRALTTEVRTPATSWRLPLRTATGSRKGVLDVRLVAFVCEKGEKGVCLARAFWWQVPVRTGKAGPTTVDLRAEVSP